MSLQGPLAWLESPEGAPAPVGENKATRKDESANDNWAFLKGQE